MISRRRLIQGIGATYALMHAPLGRAQGPIAGTLTGPRKFFVQIMVPGGMDVTLGLDPQGVGGKPRYEESEIFLGYSAAEAVEPASAGDFWLGPAAKPLAAFRQDISIINGILTSEEDQFHDSNMNHIRAGYVEVKGKKSSGLPVAFAAAMGPKPYNVISQSDSALYSPLAGEGIIKVFRMKDIEALAVSSDDKDVTDFLNSEDEKEGSLSAAFREGLLQAQYRPQVLEAIKKLGAVSSSSDPKAWIRQMAAFFLSGASDQADVGLTPGGSGGVIDSHYEHLKAHMSAQTSIWSQVADIFKIFKAIPFGAGSLFDSTTFMVGSDFSRTPYLNRSAGKDHNPLTNSVLLAGYGIRGGQVVGESHVYTAAEVSKVADRKMAAALQIKKDASSEVGYEAVKAAQAFIDRVTDTDSRAIRAIHLGSGVQFDAKSVASALPKFKKGERITPGMVALTVQKAFGVPGVLPGLRDETRWLQQLLKPKG